MIFSVFDRGHLSPVTDHQARRRLQRVRRRRHLTSLRTCSGPSPTNSGRDFLMLRLKRINIYHEANRHNTKYKIVNDIITIL